MFQYSQIGRPWLLVLTTFMVAAILTLTTDESAAAESGRRPNIILHCADDPGDGAPGCQGNDQTSTPTHSLQKLEQV